jgi:hypothetical protein
MPPISRSRRRTQQLLGPDPLQWPIEAKLQFLDYLRSLDKPGEEFKRTYRNNYVAFAHDCIDWRGEQPTVYQDEIWDAIPREHRVAVRGPHGLGKTCLAAISLLCFATTWDGDDWKAPTTASAWRQLTEFFWPEVHKWSQRVKWEKVGRPAFTQLELQTTLLKLTTGRAFAMASSDDELTEGAHADHLIYIFDEAKMIPAGRWDAAEGALMTGDTYALAISTPGEPQGRFYDIHTRKPGLENWWTRHVTIEEVIAAGRITQQQVDQLARQWGENSAVFKNRVLGEFCESSEDCVIPLAWVEAANDRWRERIRLKSPHWNWIDGAKRGEWPAWEWVSAGVAEELTALGVDVSRSDNGDKTSLARRQGETVTQLDRMSVADTMPIVGRVKGLLERWTRAYAHVDVIGIGSGPVDRLRELFPAARIQAFNASESTTMKDRARELEFVNKRSAAWWNMRELLDPAFDSTIALPPCDLLTGDLTAPRRGKDTSTGKITVESKKDIRKRLGRSTDDGDAVVMAFFPKKREPVDDESYSTSYYDYA